MYIKKSNKGIVQIKTNLMVIQQKVMSQEQNFAKLIQTLTSKPKEQEVVSKKKKRRRQKKIQKKKMMTKKKINFVLNINVKKIININNE